ncbi:hypothetical protein HaLaN_06854 [Haematococcus lacustris]|uniref:Uncharacterized protein n=1 Tax=Haematococcus lacustris TaxID=44745 RepID=A0A699YXU4_HAELA|nr:hypothetical protein HaLaN_06854 [Haematococcus lacustris]
MRAVETESTNRYDAGDLIGVSRCSHHPWFSRGRPLIDMSACSALEQQVSEWQQRIKAMEGVRNAEVDEEAKTLAHQRQQIELLRKENARLQEELGQGPQAIFAAALLHVKHAVVQAMGSAQQERIDKLQDLIETYNRKGRLPPILLPDPCDRAIVWSWHDGHAL